MKTKTTEISEQIMMAVARFGSVSQAIDHVLGAGAYARLADQLYVDLRKASSAK